LLYLRPEQGGKAKEGGTFIGFLKIHSTYISAGQRKNGGLKGKQLINIFILMMRRREEGIKNLDLGKRTGHNFRLQKMKKIVPIEKATRV